MLLSNRLHPRRIGPPWAKKKTVDCWIQLVNTFPRFATISFKKKTWEDADISLPDKLLSGWHRPGTCEVFRPFLSPFNMNHLLLQKACSGDDLTEADAFLSIHLSALPHLICVWKHLTHIYSIYSSAMQYWIFQWQWQQIFFFVFS